jgi:protein involved in polysaccharide export with SLBB domain
MRMDSFEGVVMRHVRYVVLLLAVLLGWTSFAHAQVAPAAPGAVVGAPVAPGAVVGAPDAAAIAGYRFGTADKVRVTVFNEPTLSGEFTVSSSGMLSLPLIGDLAVQGKSTGEVIKMITTALSDGYLRDPRVSIDVLTYRPFFILGEVMKAGEYPYSNGLTVMNAVATASGFSYRANKKKVFIKRAGETVEKRYDLTPDLQVQPGDTIRIAERYF